MDFFYGDKVLVKYCPIEEVVGKIGTVYSDYCLCSKALCVEFDFPIKNYPNNRLNILKSNLSLYEKKSTPSVNESWEKQGDFIDFKSIEDREKCMKWIDELLSTARQEERERFSGWIAEVFSETNDIVQMQKLLRKKLNTVDSLTSKGGTNE